MTNTIESTDLSITGIAIHLGPGFLKEINFCKKKIKIKNHTHLPLTTRINSVKKLPIVTKILNVKKQSMDTYQSSEKIKLNIKQTNLFFHVFLCICIITWYKKCFANSLNFNLINWKYC